MVGRREISKWKSIGQSLRLSFINEKGLGIILKKVNL